jgi:putative endonuclease
MYWIYVLKHQEPLKLYTGSTGDLNRRLMEHAVKKPGYDLVYQETFETVREAQGRERFLKTGDGRRWLRAKLKL